jgi:hypothetical protein
MMRDMDILATAEPPEPRFAGWRLRSRSRAVVDMIGAAAGAILYAGAAVDSVASWPSNRVLLDDPDVSRAAALLLAPSWLWLLGSVAMVFGFGRRRVLSWRQPKTPLRARICLMAAAAVAVAVNAGGILLGGTKGAVRVLPGPVYQLSADSGWTTITVAQFHLWQARFVRLDGFFMFFGLILTAGCLNMLWLHRRAIHASQ